MNLTSEAIKAFLTQEPPEETPLREELVRIEREMLALEVRRDTVTEALVKLKTRRLLNGIDEMSGKPTP